jgi:hypothetical protein
MKTLLIAVILYKDMDRPRMHSLTREATKEELDDPQSLVAGVIESARKINIMPSDIESIAITGYEEVEES